MTASERLRALMAEEAIIVVSADPTPLHEAGEPTPASVTLRNALPLIADVVEAAEGLEKESSYDTWLAREAAVRRALTALREHLEGGDVT